MTREFIPNQFDCGAPLDIGIIVVPSTLNSNQVGNMFKYWMSLWILTKNCCLINMNNDIFYK